MTWSRPSGGFGELGGGVGCLVVGVVAEHGEDDVAAAAGQAHDRGVVVFALGTFAVVERPQFGGAQ